jgi:hypothetical protein
LDRLCGPNIIAVEGDVLPAERRDMGKQIIADNLTLGTQLSHSATEINGKQRREARGLLSVFNIGVPRSCPNPSILGASRRPTTLSKLAGTLHALNSRDDDVAARQDQRLPNLVATRYDFYQVEIAQLVDETIKEFELTAYERAFLKRFCERSMSGPKIAVMLQSDRFAKAGVHLSSLPKTIHR